MTLARLVSATLACLALAVSVGVDRAAEPGATGKLLVELPAPSTAPLANGPVRYVDPVKGDDAAEGTLDKPWKTINHGLTRIHAGETLALRGGTYYENVRVAVKGTVEAP